MLFQVIQRICDKFKNEAIHSPILFKDMASMEKYIAESYGERIFIELLQNSDDVQSNNIKLSTINEHLYFANNGRPFSEDDLTSICRSGASNKKRGASIGYRGIGFKSSTYLSSNIVIYSNNTFFTFSRERSSQALGFKEQDIPLIRIPFVLEAHELEEEIVSEVEKLRRQGYSTVFIFKNANVKYLKEEIQGVDESYFLFLKNISNVCINIDGYIKEYHIDRAEISSLINRVTIKMDNFNNKMIYEVFTRNYLNKQYNIAFTVDEDGLLMESEEKKAVFHCYLPTLEKTGFPFKINADFSTDPSRKHLEFDDLTQESLNYVAELLVDIITDVVSDRKSKYGLIFEMIKSKTIFSKYSTLLHRLIREKLKENKWLMSDKGTLMSPLGYYKSPKWLEPAEFMIVKRHSDYIRARVISLEITDKLPELVDFLNDIAEKEFSLIDWITVASDVNFIQNIDDQLLAKIFGFIFKSSRNAKMIKNETIDISTCFVKNGTGKLIPLVNYEYCLDFNMFVQFLKNEITESEKEWIRSNYNITLWSDDKNNSTSINLNNSIMVNKNPQKQYVDNDSSINHNVFKNAGNQIIQKLLVSKWRSAEQQCVEIEKSLGNISRYVGKQNLGYDVESESVNGEKRYIEVKSISGSDKSIKITNNEFTAAYQYGEQYYICLIEQFDDHIVATYVKDPTKNLNFEKRVVRYEWFCDQYEGEQFQIEYSSN